VDLNVADTGEGMPREVIERAFDPFFTTKGVGKGTGLGLSQVYGVARQAGGTAQIASTPGGGTVVTLLLRRSAAAAPAEAARTEAQPILAPETGRTVLVVDNGDNRNLKLGVRNLKGVTLLATREVNPYHLLGHQSVLISEAAARKFSEALAK